MSIVIIVLGLVIGSFLNVCIYRIPMGESVILPPSHCPHCSHKLDFYDMVPILSYAILKGRCRYCKAKISPLYPMVEFLTALTFLFIFKKYDLSMISIKYMILASVSIVVSIIDFFTMNVYYVTLLPAFVVAVFYILNDLSKIINSVLGMILGYIIIKLIDKFGHMLFDKKGMGDGDAAFLGALGFILGLELTVVTIFTAFITGGIFAAYIIIFKEKSKGDYMPFAPFLGIGAYLSALFGNEIIRFYVSLFNIY